MEALHIGAEPDEAAVRRLWAGITRLLIKKGMQLTTMESATSGQIVSLATDTEGASAVVKGAYVTYSNEQKIRLGVPAETIETYGVYSMETARAMAKAARAAFSADIAIGVTGTMGNVDPVNHDSVPGRAYAAIDLRGEMTELMLEIVPQRTRLLYKLAVAGAVGGRLLALLETD